MDSDNVNYNTVVHKDSRNKKGYFDKSLGPNTFSSPQEQEERVGAVLLRWGGVLRTLKSKGGSC